MFSELMSHLPPLTGKCAIEGCEKTDTEWHHIISQAHIDKSKSREYLRHNRGNLVEYCRYHHDMTPASLFRQTLDESNRKIEDSRRHKAAKKLRIEYLQEMQIEFPFVKLYRHLDFIGGRYGPTYEVLMERLEYYREREKNLYSEQRKWRDYEPQHWAVDEEE